MPAGRCFGDLFLRVGKGLRTTRRARSILSPGRPLGSGWAPVVHPGTGAHPGGEWTRF